MVLFVCRIPQAVLPRGAGFRKARLHDPIQDDQTPRPPRFHGIQILMPLKLLKHEPSRSRYFPSINPESLVVRAPVSPTSHVGSPTVSESPIHGRAPGAGAMYAEERPRKNGSSGLWAVLGGS